MAKGTPSRHEVEVAQIDLLSFHLQPFYSEDNNELFEAIKKGAYDLPSPYWDNVSEAAKDLVAKCLTVDPKKRLTAQQVLAHPWVVSGGKASSSSTPSLHRDGTVELHIADNLRKFNARRRFREGIRKVQALTRLRRLGKMAAKRQAINLMSSVSATTPTTASGAPSTARPMSAASPTFSTAYTSGAATTTTGMSIRPSSAVGVAGRHSLFGGTAHAASVAAPASSPVPSRFAPAHNALSGATSTAAATSAYSPAARHSLPPPSSGGGYGYSGIYSSGAGSGAYGLRY
jgi:serine/threonine protein kinase